MKKKRLTVFIPVVLLSFSSLLQSLQRYPVEAGQYSLLILMMQSTPAAMAIV